MPTVVKNLAAVADAPLTQHPVAFITVMLASAANSHVPYVVAHKYTGEVWSTTVYDAAQHRIYRASHAASIRGFLKAIKRERPNIKLLGNDEVMHLRIVADERATEISWAA